MSLDEQRRIEHELRSIPISAQQAVLDSLASIMADGSLRTNPLAYVRGAARRQQNQLRVQQIVAQAAAAKRVDF